MKVRYWNNPKPITKARKLESTKKISFSCFRGKFFFLLWKEFLMKVSRSHQT